MKKIMKAPEYRIVDNVTVIIKLEWHSKGIRVGQQANHTDKRKDEKFIAQQIRVHTASIPVRLLPNN
jgi:hypothetical protein